MSKYLYLIEHEHGFVKIGVSNDPITRMEKIGGPYDCELIGAYHMEGSANSYESYIHQAISDRRFKGEWFDLDMPEDVELIEDLILERERTFNAMTA